MNSAFEGDCVLFLVFSFSPKIGGLSLFVLT
jgi:hypothetical protein